MDKKELVPNPNKLVKFTFEQYARSPFSKGTSSIPAASREMIFNNYKEKLDAVIVREMGKFDYFLYYDKNNDTYTCHVKVPSEVVPKLRYDVIIQFYTDIESVKSSNVLDRYYIRVFSNDPAYNYTYCHTHIECGLFLTDFANKIDKQIITSEAKTRNPNNELGYVKSLVFAYLIMKNKSLFNKSMYISTGFEYNPNGIMQNIMHSNDKIEQRKKLGLEVESNKKSPHKKPLTHPDSDSKFMQLTKNSDMSGNIHKTKTVSSINSIRKVKTTKRK